MPGNISLIENPVKSSFVDTKCLHRLLHTDRIFVKKKKKKPSQILDKIIFIPMKKHSVHYCL